MEPFQRLDGGAKAVLARSQREAEEAGDAHIGTEHLLLGLLVAETPARAVLVGLGASVDPARAAIRDVLGSAREAATPARGAGPTVRVQRVLELAYAVAWRERSSTVTAEHLLVAMLEEGEGLAVHVLRAQGVTLDAVLETRRGSRQQDA